MVEKKAVVRNVRFFTDDLGEEKDAINDFSAQKGTMTSQPGADPSYAADGCDGGFFFLSGKESILVVQIALLMLQKAPTSGCPAESGCKVSFLVP